jgi:hypothetical protein
VRQELARANLSSSEQNQVQCLELLGEGTYGKVRTRGLAETTVLLFNKSRCVLLCLYLLQLLAMWCVLGYCMCGWGAAGGGHVRQGETFLYRDMTVCVPVQCGAGNALRC